MDLDLVSLPIYKYASTPHLEGSRLQKGDTTDGQVSLASIAGMRAVIEEKIDAAQAGVGFTENADLLLQSRGHYLTGGGREAQFATLKLWARAHESRLLDVLEDRYLMFGEWAYSKHAIFMDQVPTMMNEFDIYDKVENCFLSTARRREMLKGSPVLSVPVLYEGPMPSDPALLWKLVRRSLAKSTNWREAFETTVRRRELDLPLAWEQTDKSDQAEGLYIKLEDDERVLARLKFVRQDFVQAILESETHHAERPIIPNLLAPGVDLYASTPQVTWEDLGLVTVRSIEELQEWVHPHDQTDEQREQQERRRARSKRRGKR